MKLEIYFKRFLEFLSIYQIDNLFTPSVLYLEK